MGFYYSILFIGAVYFAWRQIDKITSSSEAIDKQGDISNKINLEREKEDVNRLKDKLKRAKKNQ